MTLTEARALLDAARDGARVSWSGITLALRATGDLEPRRAGQARRRARRAARALRLSVFPAAA